MLALKGTDAEFRTVVLSALSARVRRMVEHELNGGEPAAQRDVMEARRSITDLAMDMAAAARSRSTREARMKPSSAERRTMTGAMSGRRFVAPAGAGPALRAASHV